MRIIESADNTLLSFIGLLEEGEEKGDRLKQIQMSYENTVREMFVHRVHLFLYQRYERLGRLHEAVYGEPAGTGTGQGHVPNGTDPKHPASVRRGKDQPAPRHLSPP